MSFAEVRLPDSICEGSKGGPQYNTVVVATASGAEQRIALWQQSLRRYDIQYGVRLEAEADELIAFFNARQGKLSGFRWKDWNDFEAVDAPQTVYDTNKIQLYKRYTSGGVNYDRKITKPVSGAVTLKQNGSPYTNFSLDTTTGIVTLNGSTGGTWLASFEFDSPVRFDSDTIEYTLDDGYRVFSSIPVVELLI